MTPEELARLLALIYQVDLETQDVATDPVEIAIRSMVGAETLVEAAGIAAGVGIPPDVVAGIITGTSTPVEVFDDDTGELIGIDFESEQIRFADNADDVGLQQAASQVPMSELFAVDENGIPQIDLNRVIEAITPDNTANPIPFIGGLPEDFRAADLEDLPGQARQDRIVGGPPLGTIGSSVIPKYRIGDNERMFVGWAPEAIAQLQIGMIDAGLLELGSFAPGLWDPTTSQAMFAVMDYSNNTGRDFGTAITFLADVNTRLRSAADGARATNLPTQTIRTPDYATAASASRAQLEQGLGRRATPAEIKLLADQMHADGIAQAESQIVETNTLAQEIFDAQGRLERPFLGQSAAAAVAPGGRGEPAGRPGPPDLENLSSNPPRRGEIIGGPGFDLQGEIERRRVESLLDEDQVAALLAGAEEAAAGGDVRRVQDIDPVARMRELFRKVFGDEIAVNDRRADQQTNRGILMRSILGLDGALSGN